MKIILDASHESAVELSKCLEGNPCEVGRYTGQYDGVPGTLVSYYKGFFVCNIPEWDAECDAHNTYREICIDPDKVQVDPWMAAKMEIPVKATLPYQENPYLPKVISCFLDYRIPNTGGSKWRTTQGDEVIVSGLSTGSALQLDTDVIGCRSGVTIIDED